MSQSASEAAVFYRQVAKERRVWTVMDSGGFPAPKTSSGERAQPFWSSLSRVEKIIQTVPDYAGFSPHEISWSDFVNKWVPGLAKDRIVVGVNWSGLRAVGYDVEPERVKISVEAQLESD
jgi:hypothetical protein